MVFRALWIIAFALLAACEAGDRAMLGGGAITIAGPPGYCPDRSAASLARRDSLVVLGSCASVLNNPDASAPAIPAVLTASVSRLNGANLSRASRQLGRYFRSGAGRAALARNGDPRSVRILATRRSQGAYVMKIRDRSPGALPGISTDYWRAIFDIKGRLITLSVIAFRAKPMSDAYARATLDGFINRVRQENADPVGEN